MTWLLSKSLGTLSKAGDSPQFYLPESTIVEMMASHAAQKEIALKEDRAYP